MRKLIHFLAHDVRKFSFYSLVGLSLVTLVSFQNCGKVKFTTTPNNAVATNSCGTIQMTPSSGIYTPTSITFEVLPPKDTTISTISWQFRKDTPQVSSIVHTATSNPVTHTFNGANEGPGQYLATATYIYTDGTGCELTRAFQVLVNDICANPTGISGPTTGFVGVETSPFSVNDEPCFQGNATWDMNGDGVPEYSGPVDDEITHIYTEPGTYTVTVIVTNSEDGSQTTLTHVINIQYAACTNGATNPPTCDQCPVGQSLVNGQCENNCTNGATNPPLCTQCPTGQALVNGQCVNTCTNGATNPPTCDQCPVGQSLVNGQCVNNCTNGATNPPSCTQCPTGQALVNGQCVNTCTNGATNPPTCDQCPAGQSLVNGQCVNNCTNGATNPPSCTQCPTGQTMINGQCQTPNYSWVTGNWGSCSATACGTSGTQTRTVTCRRNNDNTTVADSFCTTNVGPKPSTSQPCNARACNSCTLDGVTVAHGQSRTFFSTTSVACGQTCSGQSRTCNDGTLSGPTTHNRANCAAAACTYAWVTGSWSACSATACGTSGTQTRSVICRRSDGTTVADSNCSGTKPATTQNCNARACNSCTLPWGGTIAHNATVQAYQTSQVACGQTCAVQTRKCTDGTLSGTFTQRTCSVAACPVNGQCGSAHGGTFQSTPTSNLCTKGTASAVSTTTSSYTWTCQGTGGGSNASCSALRQHYTIGSCGFGLKSSNWSPRPPNVTNRYGECEWTGDLFMGSSREVNATFYIGDYIDANNIVRLNNPNQWTITAVGCTLSTSFDPNGGVLKNYCKASYRSYSGTPLVWNATLTATNNTTGEVRVVPIKATFKPNLLDGGGTNGGGGNTGGSAGGGGNVGGSGGNGTVRPNEQLR